jgi:hypothetical protein
MTSFKVKNQSKKDFDFQLLKMIFTAPQINRKNGQFSNRNGTKC